MANVKLIDRKVLEELQVETMGRDYLVDSLLGAAYARTEKVGSLSRNGIIGVTDDVVPLVVKAVIIQKGQIVSEPGLDDLTRFISYTTDAAFEEDFRSTTRQLGELIGNRVESKPNQRDLGWRFEKAFGLDCLVYRVEIHVA